MNLIFREYNKAVINALDSLIKTDDLIARKTENFLKIIKEKEAKTILHCGFGPVALGLANEGYQVFLMDNPYEGSNTPDVPLIVDQNKHLFAEPDYNIRYDVVIAPDEYFTFAKDEYDQRQIISQLCDLTKNTLILTLSDYKNMSENTKDFGDPQGYKTKNGSVTYIEKNTRNRNSFTTKVYQIDHNDQLTTFGPFERRTLFFKQLARQAEDNKSTKFNFQKNIMYKGMLKKNYEHIIAINF